MVHSVFVLDDAAAIAARARFIVVWFWFVLHKSFPVEGVWAAPFAAVCTNPKRPQKTQRHAVPAASRFGRDDKRLSAQVRGGVAADNMRCMLVYAESRLLKPLE